VDPFVFVVSVAALGVGAGLAGALFGLGGGIFLVPALTLLYGVNIRFAIGASIVAVIATSSGAAAAYVGHGLVNIRIGMLLELAAVVGALAGAMIAGSIPTRWLYAIFGLLLLYSIVPMVLRRGVELKPGGAPDPLARRLRLSGVYRDAATGREDAYAARRVPTGATLMCVSGIISGLLGIGSGIFNVLAMVVTMGLPLKVATATSNFMIGAVGAASALVYFSRGEINPLLAAPVVLGILVGSRIGVRLLRRLHPETLRILFVPVLLYTGGAMLLRALRWG
jgi:hypothetical protein